MTVDQQSLMLLEAKGMAADCVGILAQYVNSDFALQPYIGAYKRH